MPAKTHGRLGAANLAAATNTAVYVVPAARKATCTVSACNRSASDVMVRLAHIDGALGALALEDYIEYDAVIPAGGVLERTGITMTATHTLMGYASAVGVSMVVAGVEEDV